jgi:uncharacterized protein YcaQ
VPITITLEHLRDYAVARTLFAPTTLPRAIARLGFVQADPIRAPARAQDLTLRHRVAGYRAGDLERRYPRLDVDEDFFVNFGFLPRDLRALMHPRSARVASGRAATTREQQVLDYVRAHGPVHPRTVDAHFQHGRVTNWFGGSSNASTQMLDVLHYKGLLRVARRDGGTRVYAAQPPWGPVPRAPEVRARLDRLVDLIVGLYAPLPSRSLGYLLSLLGRGVPQWRSERAAALTRAVARLAHAKVDGTTWYWPADESPRASRWRRDDDTVRLLAPFDPIVWDRRRFALCWGWEYRFEAYTPAARRRLGYYALPLLWRGRVPGWGNLTWREGQLHAHFGFVSGTRPVDPAFVRGLDEELARIRAFLG